MDNNTNNYTIVLKNSNTMKLTSKCVSKMTFEEAVQVAYMEKNKLGFEYKIVSVTQQKNIGE